MKRALLLLVAAQTGCGFFFGPGFSLDDHMHFMERPHVVEHQGNYKLCWRYGQWGFYFSPEHAVREGRLLFALQGTSSSGALTGRYGELPITGEKEIAALRESGVFWLEPNGEQKQLEIRNGESCVAQQGVPADG